MSEPKLLELENRIKELEKLTPITLWEGETNNPSEITLSDSIVNYRRLKLFFRDNDSQLRGVEIYTNNQNSIRVSLDIHYNQGQWFNVKMKSIALTDKSVAGIGAAEYEFGSQSISYNNNIFIMRVEGYKN